MFATVNKDVYIGGKTWHVLRASSYTWGHVGAAGGKAEGTGGSCPLLASAAHDV